MYIGNCTDTEAQKDADGSYGDLDGTGSYVTGQNVLYQRGIIEIGDTNVNMRTMMNYWSHVAFIVNSNRDPVTRRDYPNYVEAERGLDAFVYLKSQMQAVQSSATIPTDPQPFSVPRNTDPNAPQY